MLFVSGFQKQLNADLIAEFPNIKGFSKRNLERVRMWYPFYSEGALNCDTACVAIGQKPVGQPPKLDPTEIGPQAVAPMDKTPKNRPRLP